MESIKWKIIKLILDHFEFFYKLSRFINFVLQAYLK